MEEEVYLGLLSLRMTDPMLRRFRQAGNVGFYPDIDELFQDTLLRVVERFERDKVGQRTEGVTATFHKGGIVKIDPDGIMRVEHHAEEETRAEKEAEEVLAQVASSLKRARKTQAEIKSLKKKTQAILDKLP
jgi:hypothetical protein